MGKYDKIIHQERPMDPKHPPMTIHNRAAQFAPFDALTGFGSRIYEVSRLTDSRREISEEVKADLNARMQLLLLHLEEHPIITVTYFLPDKTKSGGSYETITAPVSKINVHDERLLLAEDVCIAFEDIIEISGEILSEFSL